MPTILYENTPFLCSVLECITNSALFSLLNTLYIEDGM